MSQVIAVDLGAESGRVQRITLDERGFHEEEIHRFPNIPVSVQGTLYWDALRLWHEIVEGISRAKEGAVSIGLDAWGVDFALLDNRGALLSNPISYRDTRTDGMMEWVFERLPKRAIFERTGVQFMPLNTLFQLASLIKAKSSLLDAAATYVSLPDLFIQWLGGRRACEFTHATTTQFYNPRTGDWDRETLSELGLPLHIFPEIAPPGTQTGEYEGLPIIFPATHDTGSAVAGIPTTTDDFAYVSSGTWSLVGLELPAPIINDAVFAANVTNEGGVFGTFRFLKNVAGMWLAQQCRVTWKAGGQEYGYDDLPRLALSAQPFRSLIDPDDLRFLPPGNMPARIREFCAETGQPVPESNAQVMRTIYESLALKYRYVLERMALASGKAFSRVHVIGGGSRNAALCQMTADAMRCTVIAGPSEATALGNAMVQFIALKQLNSLAEARALLARSAQTVTYEPKQPEVWEAPYRRFEQLIG
jgi:rhamnulokinase